MRSPITILTILWIPLGLTIARNASANEWSTVVNDDVKVLTRVKDGSQVSELLAETEMDCTSAEVRAVLVDDEYTKRTPYVAEARIIEDRSPAQANKETTIKYTRLTFPIVNDRDYYIEVIRESDLLPTGQGVFLSRFRPWKIKQPVPEATVRVTEVQGYWKVEPSTKHGKVRVSYYLHFDPGGNIPGWVVNMGNKRVMPDVLRSLYKEVLRRRSVALENSL